MPPKFCWGNQPPTLDDTGLKERIAKHPLPDGGLYIYGPIGAHKTHLATARAVESARRGLRVQVIRWKTFRLDVCHTYGDNATATEKQIIDHYAGFDHLVIDELFVGDEPETNASVQIAHELFDRRMCEMQLTDVTTNVDRSKLAERSNQAVARRILDETCSPYRMWEKP